MMRKIIIAVCIAMGVVIAYSQQPQGREVVIKNISVDSLSNLLKESFSVVNKENYYKIAVTTTSEDISPVTNRTEEEFVRKNVKKYLSGDTLRITSKDKDGVMTYIISKR
ncbi:MULTISPECIES: hypothetical protein [Bacteroides]|uniref:hypothetical protein n=1 Tax=Bacteroides TaxID=816 RepID=UPI0025B3BF21|nr:MULTISPECIES: hypothetical protein [Bacteroides]